MSTDLFTFDGKRKYLSRQELDAFILAAHTLERPEVRTLALVLAHSGCRLSEALALTAQSIDISQGVIVFQTLKQREALRYRAVPLPDTTLDALELVHRLRKTQKSKAKTRPLWAWGRTQAWKHIKAVFEVAGIKGVQASPKGLRHGFAVRAMETTRNPRLVQKWLGHRSLETTAIYMDLVGSEERQSAIEMWN